MSRSPYPTKSNNIIRHQIMESKSNYYHMKNDENNWDLIKKIINKYSVSLRENGYFLSDCIGRTYDIEDIYNNMKGLMLIFNTDYQEQQQNKKRKKDLFENIKDNTSNNIKNIHKNNNFYDNYDEEKKEDNKFQIFNSFHELPDLMFRKNHAQHFLQNFKLPSNSNMSIWPFTIYLFSGDNIYFSDGYNNKNYGDFIFNKSINNRPIIFTNFINQLY